MSNLFQLDAIIFDFGGVIIDLDYKRTADALSALRRHGLPALDYRDHTHIPFFDDYEMGVISSEKFREELREKLDLEGDDTSLDAAWNAMILDLPDEHIDFLEQLGKEKRIFLLSNTNALHEEFFTVKLKETGQFDRLMACFEATYYSHDLNMRKPNPNIFEHLIEKHALNPARTLFIDDTQMHVEGARSTGLQGYHLQYGKETILDVFQRQRRVEKVR